MDWFRKIQNSLKLLKKKSSKTYIGIDVLDESIKNYVVLNRVDNHVEIESYGYDFEWEQLLQTAIELDASIVLSTPREGLIFRVIELDNLSKHLMEKGVVHVIEKHLPVPLDDYYWSYKKNQKNEETTGLIVCGIEKLKRDESFDKLESLGAKNFFLTTTTLAFLNVILFSEPKSIAEKNCILMNMRFREIEIYLIHKGELLLAKSLKLGTEYMLRILAEKAGLAYEEVKDIFLNKKSFDETEKVSDLQVREAMHLWLEKVLKQVDLARRFFVAKKNESLNKIFISGAFFVNNNDLLYMAEAMQKRFSLETEIFNPEANEEFKVLCHKEEEQNSNIFKDFAVPLGLALHGFRENVTLKDLSLFADTGDASEKDDLKESSVRFRKIFTLVNILALMIFILCLFSYKSEYKKNFALNKEYEISKKNIRVLEDKTRKKEKTLDKIKGFSPLFFEVYTYFFSRDLKDNPTLYSKYIFTPGKVKTENQKEEL